MEIVEAPAHLIACLIIALSTTPAVARRAPAAAPHCCFVAAGTPVMVTLAEPVSTKIQKTGDLFRLSLAQPVVVRGQVAISAGTPGVGEVVESAKPGVGGRPAKLVLAARYLVVNGRHLPLEGLQLAAAGHNNAI